MGQIEKQQNRLLNRKKKRDNRQKYLKEIKEKAEEQESNTKAKSTKIPLASEAWYTEELLPLQVKKQDLYHKWKANETKETRAEYVEARNVYNKYRKKQKKMSFWMDY